jgi:hypothetical protein
MGALVRGKLRVPRTFPCVGGPGVVVPVSEGVGALGDPCVLVRLRLVVGAGRVGFCSSASSRPRAVSRRRRVDFRGSSGREGASEGAGVSAGSGLMGSVGEAREGERVRRAEVVLPLRRARFEDFGGGLVLVVDRSAGWLAGTFGGAEGARSLMGLISSGPGRVGEGIERTDPGSPRPFQRVEEAGVMMGEGRGGRGLPDALVKGVCCADAG